MKNKHMKRALILILSSLTIGLFACTTSVQRMPAPIVAENPLAEEVVPEKPQGGWEAIFFESINETTAIFGLEQLRKTSIEENDIEVRVWGGFGLTRLEGFILKRSKGKWTAQSIEYDRNNHDKIVSLPEPSQGWENAWKSLLDHKIITLPDAGKIGCEGELMDGFSYVVEIKKGNNYRTYMYDNPDYVVTQGKCSEASEILSIARIISKEYKRRPELQPK